MNDPLWYKNAILYELHVRSFFDGNGDGIGDFGGLVQKLDYLQDLGVTALWLLPFYPSPLRDDGYDIADYLNVHPSYGTLKDFKQFLREAHRRGLRVVTELVLNHTSDQHPWFQKARRAKPGSPERNFYVWNSSPDKYAQARIIFKDFEKSNWSWDPAAKAYYWHRFYSHQPDLNYDNPAVRKEILRAADFWMDLGVDGLRLDAVPYLYEREGTNCENLSESHAFLKELRRHLDGKFRDRMLLAEANQWPEDARAYFGDGDECQMAFHFPLMPRLFMAIRREDRFPIVEILQQTPKIPENCQWALFLRNHDELTLEMVTDEDRDYMVRVYAQDPQARINLGIRRRLAPLLGNNRRKIELMKGLLFSLPGSPVLYYGDEIGMGDNVRLPDRNGVRTPMHWSPSRNAGFSEARARRLYLPPITEPEYHFEAVNVEVQEKNPHSLLRQVRRMIALRKQHRAFGEGSMQLLHPENGKILSFMRQHGEEKILVAANLSRFVQHAELDLSAWKGLTPVELFGATRFPPIGERTTPLTLGPHAFYWFRLEAKRQRVEMATPGEPPQLPLLKVQGRWDDLLRGRGREALEQILPDYLQRQRWFGGKARRIKEARILETIPVGTGSSKSYLTLIRAGYFEGESELFLLPLGFMARNLARLKPEDLPYGAAAQIKQGNGKAEKEGLLVDALGDKAFCRSLLAVLARGRRVSGESGDLVGEPAAPLRKIRASARESLEPALIKAEQSNSSILFGNSWILKLYRNLGEGPNPEMEVMKFLSDRTTFKAFPPLGGVLEYRSSGSEPKTLALLQRFVPNAGDAWSYTLDALGRYFEDALAVGSLPKDEGRTVLDLAGREPPPLAQERIGTYLVSARLLGERLAQLHLALSSVREDPHFAPEPFTELYQRSIYQLMRGAAVQSFALLRRRAHDFPEEIQPEIKQLLSAESQVLALFQEILKHKITGQRIRCHGDFHLGQVLTAGKEFVLIDFEGEPARSFGDRRIKRSPLKDVAGMLRSFQYAADAALLAREDQPRLDSWARTWRVWVSAAFLRSYLTAVSPAALLPKSQKELRLLLRAYLMEKAMYELRYEMNNRPDWIQIPVRGALHLLEE